MQDAQTASPRAPVPGLDIVVRIHAPLAGLAGRLQKLLEQTSDAVRLVLIDDSGDEALFAGLQRLAREQAHVLLLRNTEPASFSACWKLALIERAGRDVFVIGPCVRVFPGLVKAVRRAALADARAGMLCPLSNQDRHAQDPAWQGAWPVPSDVSKKGWAKLIQRTSRRERPTLTRPTPKCVWIRAGLLDALGPAPLAAVSDDLLFDDYARRSLSLGFTTRLLDDAYVSIKSEADEPADQAAPASHPSPAGTVAALLAWHVRRGSAKNRAAPLILLDSSPFFGAGLDEGREIVRLLEVERWPRAVLMYRALGGFEIAEIIAAEWANPLFYRWPLAGSQAQIATDLAAAESALATLLGIFQVGSVHVQGLDVWPKIVRRPLLERALPYSILFDEDAFDGLDVIAPTSATPAPESEWPWHELLLGAHRVLCASEATQHVLSARLGVKLKRCPVLPSPSDASAQHELLSVMARVHRECAARAPKSARRWRSRAELRQLAELRVVPGPLVSSPRVASSVSGAPEPRRPLEQWVRDLGARVPPLLRSVRKRLRP